jgi:hypothetical protein
MLYEQIGSFLTREGVYDNWGKDYMKKLSIN